MNQRELPSLILISGEYGIFAGLLIKLHYYSTACYHKQGRSVTPALAGIVLINSRCVVTCDMCHIKIAAEQIKV